FSSAPTQGRSPSAASPPEGSTTSPSSPLRWRGPRWIRCRLTIRASSATLARSTPNRRAGAGRLRIPPASRRRPGGRSGGRRGRGGSRRGLSPEDEGTNDLEDAEDDERRPEEDPEDDSGGEDVEEHIHARDDAEHRVDHRPSLGTGLAQQGE